MHYTLLIINLRILNINITVELVTNHNVPV